MVKPRPDDKLAALTPEQGEQLWLLLQTPGVSYEAAVQFVKREFAISTSDSALSRWWEKRALAAEEQQILRTCNVADGLGEKAAEHLPKLTAALKAKLVRSALEVQLTGGDPDRVEKFMRVVAMIDKAKIDTAKLTLDRDKFEVEFCEKLLTMLNDKRAQDIAASSQPRADQIAALRKVAFADIDATVVELPR